LTAVEHLPVTAAVVEICAQLEADAAVVLDGAMRGDQVEAIRRELDPYLSAAPCGDNQFGGFRTTRVGALIARSPECRQLALHPTVNAVAAQFLAPHADGYQLHFTQAVRIGPGEPDQPLHRDRGVWAGYVPRRIETQLSTIWAVDDFTEENGATQIAPGSHQWDRNRQPEPHELAASTMAAGSVLLYTGTVLHGGGANRSRGDRLGVLLHYALNWLRQEENQYLSCPPHIAQTLEPELQALIGYSRGGAVLGFYSDPTPPGTGRELVDPERLFDPQPPRS
jgi:ectoine hydroxylase-related dioxygenase (phytanoyl-CoA dioxygenase family)